MPAFVSSNSDSLGAKVARTVLEKTLRVRRGENVIVEAWSESLPWATPFITEARMRGAHPLLLYEDEAAFWDSIAAGASRSTGQVGSHEWAALSKTSAYVFFFGPAEWTRFDDLPTDKARGIAAYNPEWYRRAARAKVRGARMYLGRTSPAAAQRWKLDLNQWREELLRASLVPPSELHRLGARISRRLRGGKSVTITHPNGTKLAFRLGKYPIQLDDALVDADDLRMGNNVATIPGGVVGVAIDHTSVEGIIVGNHDVYPDGARGPVSDIRWNFEGGHLTDHSFGTGGEFLEERYSKAPRAGRDRLSYFSIGLNPELSHSPQMEDQEIGDVMVRLGGNQFVGGKNPSPFVAWTVVKGADLAIDGQPVVEGGRIV
jgi:leucyl aminopeptidase (aminopeptidase T)